MRLKSKGLGKKELVMDFREYEIVREGDEVVIVGTIRDPVTWDFTIRMCEDDLAGLVAFGSNRKTIGMLLRSLFRRTPRDHWEQDREEHLVEGRRRLEVAKENAEERAQMAMLPPALPKPKRRRRSRTKKDDGGEATAGVMLEPAQ